MQRILPVLFIRPLRARIQGLASGFTSTGAFLTAFLTGGLLAGVAAVGGLSGCSSTPDNALQLTDEEYLGLYFENFLRYMDLGDIDRAQDQARRALKIDPKNDRFLFGFARCAVLRGDSQSLQVALDTLPRIADQNDWRVQATWAAAIERKGILYDEAAEAVRTGKRATKAADPQARADELREEANGFWREAKARYERSVELRSGEPEPINGLVRTCALLGQNEESIEHARDLITAIQSSQRLVNTQLDDDEITAERESGLFRAQRSNREFEVSARLHIATLLRSQGDLEGSVTEFDAIIALDPDLAEAHSLRGQVLFELGEYTKARAAVTRFLEMKAQTAEFGDPAISKAFDLQEQCDRAIRAKERRG